MGLKARELTPSYDDLLEENRFLKSELMMEIEPDRIARIGCYLKLEPMCATVVYHLWMARGRFVNIQRLMESASAFSDSTSTKGKCMHVATCKIRKRIGRDGLQSYVGSRESPGLYRLTLAGKHKVWEALTS